jgi:putative FmdB family regulatory protein
MKIASLRVYYGCAPHTSVPIALQVYNLFGIKALRPRPGPFQAGGNRQPPGRVPRHNNFTGTDCHCYNDCPNGQEVTLPLYEYRCEKCGSRIEKIQKFSDPPLATCEKCGGDLMRLLSAPAIQFKGSGWYVTDYARKSSPEKGGKSDGGSSAKAPAAESSPAKSKPADSKSSTSS